MSSLQAEVPRHLTTAPWNIGFGTYQLGADTFSACLKALECGYRHIDTAALYQNEIAVADAVKQSGIPRDEIFITTKVSLQDANARRISEAVSSSLEKLERIDLILLHSPTNHFVEDWELLRSEAERHGIQYAGVSNFRQQHLAKLDPLPAVNQIEITPFLPRTTLLEWCRDRNIQVTAHSPLAKARRMEHPVFSGFSTSPAQVLIAWSLAKGCLPIVRSRNDHHIKQNLKAATLQLTTEEIRLLDSLEDGFATHPQHL